MSSTLTNLTAATTWSGTDLFYALVGGNSRKIAAAKFLVAETSSSLAMQDSTTAQTFRLYRTFTDTSNYERLALQSGSGYFEVAAETAGTGTDDIDVRVTPSGIGKVSISNSANAAYNALQLRNSAVNSNAQVRLQFDNDATPGAGSGGVIFYTSTISGFVPNSFGFWNYQDGSIYFATNNSIRLLVDKTGYIGVQTGTSLPAGGSTTMNLIFSNAGSFGIYVGSGVPTVSAGKGSIYLRSDGSSTSTRLYVNTDGSTTWTNVTTAA